MKRPRATPSPAAMLRQQLRRPRPCLLCGTWQTTHAALFAPDVPELWGGVRGKQRLIVYRLCVDCFALPDRCTAVEARIQAHLGARRN